MHEGPTDSIVALGWLTCGREVEDPTAVVRRPKFDHPAIKHLYKIEITHLFARLFLDDGKTLKRDDPLLFEKELDDLLAEYGPKIWPEIGKGDRSHLRQADEDSYYPADLVYPKNAPQIKKLLRKLILVKKARAGSNVYSLLNKQGEKRTWRTPKRPVSSASESEPKRSRSIIKIPASSSRPVQTPTAVKIVTPPRGSRRGLRSGTPLEPDHHLASDAEGSHIAFQPPSPVGFEFSSAFQVHARSPVGVQTRSSAKTQTPKKSTPVKRRVRESILRLYSRQASGGIKHGDMVWNCAGTSDELFAQVSQKLGMDVNWLLFHFPEDMFPDDMTGKNIPIFRIDRGSRETDAVYDLSMRMLHEAPDFSLPMRTVQVQCGLDMSSPDEAAY